MPDTAESLQRDVAVAELLNQRGNRVALRELRAQVLRGLIGAPDHNARAAAQQLLRQLDATLEHHVVRVVIRSRHPDANAFLPSTGAAIQRFGAAVKKHLAASCEARVALGMEMPQECSDADRVLLECPARSATLYHARVPGAHRLAAKSAEQRTSWQNAFSASGYVAFVAGEDLLGAYDTCPVGRFFEVSIVDDRRESLRVFGNSMLEVRVEPCAEVDREALCSTDNAYKELLRDGDVDVPWHVVAAQCHSLQNFVSRHAAAEGERMPGPLPTACVHPRTGQSWTQCVASLVERMGVNTPLALSMLQDVIQAGDPSRAVTGFWMKGLAGTGKTRTARLLCSAMGLPCVEPSIELLQGGMYRGDAAAAFGCLFARAANAYALYPVLLDEIDLYTASAGGDTNSVKEQIGFLLQYLTAPSKPPMLLVFAASNNDLAVNGAVKSRFSQIIAVGAPSYAFHKALFARVGGAKVHTFVREAESLAAGDGARDWPAIVAVASIGLTARDEFDIPCRNALPGGGVQRPLVAAAHVKKGNTFPSGTTGEVTPWDIALHRAGPDGELLRRFLVSAVDRGMLSGRMVALIKDGTKAYLDVELAHSAAAQAFDIGAARFTVASQPGMHRCRCFGPMGVMDVFWALQQLAAHVDAAHFNFVTAGFLNHAAGNSSSVSADARLATGAELVREFCQGAVDASVLLFPPSHLFLTSDGPGDGVTNRETHEQLSKFFAVSGNGKFHATVAYCSSERELKPIRALGIALSSMLELLAAATDESFTCVVCGDESIANTGVKGCRHVPAGIHESLPEAEKAARRINPRGLRYAVTYDGDAPPFEAIVKLDTFSFSDINRVCFVACGCEARSIRELSLCRSGGLHGPTAVVRVWKTTRVEEVRFHSADEIQGLAVGVGGVKAVRVCCGHDECRGELGPCSARVHTKPSLEAFNRPSYESGWCPHCHEQKAAGAHHCVFCSRLLPPSCRPLRLHSLEVFGRRWFDPQDCVDEVKAFVRGECRTPLEFVTASHKRSPATKRCERCNKGLPSFNDGTSDQMWRTHMAVVPCGVEDEVLRGTNLSNGANGVAVLRSGTLRKTLRDLVLIEGFEQRSVNGHVAVLHVGQFDANGALRNGMTIEGGGRFLAVVAGVASLP
jgi:hypothetical protein